MVHVTIVRADGGTEQALAPFPDEAAKFLATFDGMLMDKAQETAEKSSSAVAVALRTAFSDVEKRIARRQERMSQGRQRATELAEHQVGSLTVKILID